MKICAIHQPNFFPWLGYFDKIRRSHKFVVLDNVQYPKTGSGTWSNRVAVVDNDGKRSWITAPIVRKHGVWNINETEFQNSPWRKKILHNLQTNYARARYFSELKEAIFELVEHPSNDLVEYNFNAISVICTLLNIDISDKIVFASTLNTDSSSTQRLIDITKQIGGSAYLAGGGASGYQEDQLFGDQGIELIYQNFEHPIYEQANTSEFVAGLSVIDYLFNCGIRRASERVEGSSLR